MSAAMRRLLARAHRLAARPPAPGGGWLEPGAQPPRTFVETPAPGPATEAAPATRVPVRSALTAGPAGARRIADRGPAPPVAEEEPARAPAASGPAAPAGAGPRAAAADRNGRPPTPPAQADAPAAGQRAGKPPLPAEPAPGHEPAAPASPAAAQTPQPPAGTPSGPPPPTPASEAAAPRSEPAPAAAPATPPAAAAAPQASAPSPPSPVVIDRIEIVTPPARPPRPDPLASLSAARLGASRHDRDRR